MIHKIVCSRCKKIVGSFIDEDVTTKIVPFALEDFLYDKNDITLLKVGNIDSDIFCSDCANKPRGDKQ